MDEYEQMAHDLEMRQMDRYRRCTKKIDFWQETEVAIFKTIVAFRAESKTYHPDNIR